MSSLLRWVVATIGLILTAGTIAACGSSSSSSSSSHASGAASSSSSSSASSSAPSKALKGAPVVIETTSIGSSPIGSEAEAWSGAKAAARAINAKGGIKGHPVDILPCDTQATPNGELACARKAASSPAIATAGSLTLFTDAGYLSILAHTKLDSVGASSAQPVDYAAPNAYAIDFAPSAFAECGSPAIRKLTGESKVSALVEDLPITRADGIVLAAATKVQGGVPAGPVIVPANTTDMSPVVPRVAALGTNLVSLLINPGSAAGFVAAAAAAGKTYSYCTIDALISGKTLVALASSSKAFYIGALLPPISQVQQHPGLKQFIQQMTAERATGDSAADVSTGGYNPISLRAWLAVNDIAQVDSTVKDPTSRTEFDAAIKTAKVSNFGIIPNIDFAKPQSGGPFKRVFNPLAQLEVWDKTTHDFVPPTGAPPVDGLKALGY